MNKTNTRTLDVWEYYFEDVQFKINRINTTKYLTIIRAFARIKGVNKANRKDDKMAQKKSKPNFIKWGSIILLALAAVKGFGVYLGGQPSHYIVSGLLCFVLLLLVTTED